MFYLKYYWRNAMVMSDICKFSIIDGTGRKCVNLTSWLFQIKFTPQNTDFVCSGEQCGAIGDPVYSTQISNWLANANFYSVAMGYHVVWFDTELQTLLISSIHFCPSLCITEPSGHLFTNKPLMAQIFRGLSLWHGRKCLHLSARLDTLLVSHQNSSFTGEKLRRGKKLDLIFNVNTETGSFVIC